MKSRLAAAILAGGESKRFGGIPKGTLELPGGQTIVETMIGEIASAGIEDIIISANDPEPYRRHGREIIPDVRRGVGPMGGIESALLHYSGRQEAVLFLPCDLPGITACEISVLQVAFCENTGRVVVSETGLSFWHPLCAVVHNDVLSEVSRAIDQGERRIRTVWENLGATSVHFDDEIPFFNVNTPEDLAEWIELSKKDTRRRGLNHGNGKA